MSVPFRDHCTSALLVPLPHSRHPLYLPVINYTSALLVDARNRFQSTTNATTVEFFKCLIAENRTTLSAQWSRIKDNIVRIVVNLDESDGSLSEGGATALYPEAVEAIISVMAREGSADSMMKKLMADVGWLSAGRGGEMALLVWEGLMVRGVLIMWLHRIAVTRNRAFSAAVGSLLRDRAL